MLLGRASILKNTEEEFCVNSLEALTALSSKCSFLLFFTSRALSSLVSCSPAFDYRWKGSADHSSLQKDPVHVSVLPFRQCFIFLFLTRKTMWKCSIPKHQKTQNWHCLADLPFITGAPTDWCLQHEAENEIWLLPQFPDSRTNRWFTSLACFYVKFLFPASLSHLYSMMGKLQELNWKSSFQGQPQANWCLEHLQFMFKWSVFSLGNELILT